MDSLKEIYDALSQRIKSPIWGYIILAFIAINWKALYYLFFSGKPALMKFNFFEANTDQSTLYMYPLGFGLFAALAAPHVSNFGAWWATKPINSMRIREVSAAHKVLQEKNQLAAERDNEKAIYEQSLIDEAKRDQEISEIEDEEIRQDLEEKVKSSRAKGKSDPDLQMQDGSSSAQDGGGLNLGILNELDLLSSQAKQILLAATVNENSEILMPNLIGEASIIVGSNTYDQKTLGNREWMKYREALDMLVSNGFVIGEGYKGELFSVTSLGFAAADLLRAA